MSKIAGMKIGLTLALLTIVYGYGLGGVFGVFEDGIKGHLKAEGEGALATAYEGDEAAMNKVVSKSWVYFKRAHLHANGLGTTAVALILLLAFASEVRKVNAAAALCLGVGALGYSLFWMLAGLRAPGMGSTGAAKASLAWLAVPSTALSVLGLLTVLVVMVRGVWARSR